MIDVRDYELRKTTTEPPDVPPARPAGLWIAAAVLVDGIAAAAYIVFFSGGGGTQSETGSRAAAPANRALEQPRPLGGEAEAIALPPLAETDALVRELVSALSS